MKNFLCLLKWDILLLNRNQLFLLAAAVATIYTGVFYLIKPLGNLDTIVVVLIFNDPVVTGYLFAGVLLLFDKNQNTLQAVAVLPIPFKMYLLSKIIVLCFLAVFVAFVMAWATRGLHFQWVHLFFAVFMSTFIFSALGFTMASLAKNFNQFLFFSIPFFVLTALPFVAFFEYAEQSYFFIIPSAGGIGLLQAAFESKSFFYNSAMYAHLVIWCGLSWLLTVKVTSGQLL